MTAVTPSALHEATQSAFNRGDVDGLLALYADGACLVDQEGSVARGPEEIRRVWAGFVALDGRITMTTRYCVVAGELALMSNAWRFESESGDFESASAEVAVRVADGTWRYLIDNPTGGATS